MPAQARALHILDIGTQQYGDCLLFESGSAKVLFDGGHKGDQDLIFDQLEKRVPKSGDALHVSLLVVTHAHGDHIGALPKLVADNRLVADWALVADPGYGWGRSTADAATPLDSVSDAMRGIVAALREEPPPPSLTDAELRQFIADAAAGELDYEKMLQTLRDGGTHVVRHGRDSEAALLNAFKTIGLEVYGPTKAHLQAASSEVLSSQHDAIAAADAALRSDATGDPLSILRRLITRAPAGDAMDAMTDALADAQQRNGAAVNCQSTVLGLKAGKWRALLGGDMQFNSSVPTIEPHVHTLRGRIKDAKPFHLFKLSHHGSSNGWDRALYDEIGKPKYLAISLGLHKGHHPDQAVLDDLRSLPNATWARSDLNGQVRFSFGATKIAVTKARGKLNDPTPPQPDTAIVPFNRARSTPGGVGEIVTRAPYGVPVTITIGAESARPLNLEDRPVSSGGPLPRLELFGGRDMPRLLFVTSRDALADRIGVAETALVLDALRQKRVLLYDELAPGASYRGAQAAVREQIARARDVRGVVLLGGYSVVPSQRLFCLPPDLQDLVRPEEDIVDDFLVWSDDFYADTDGDGQAELPITRMPDGRTPELVFAQLQANGRARGKRRTGIRNRERKFADDVFKNVPGTGDMLESAFATVDDPPHVIDGDVVYLMLHGSDFDGTVYCGQLGKDGSPDKWPVVTMKNIPPVCGPVVFTGCCWGALITARPAKQTPDGSPMGSRTPDQSLALRILRSGATAFVGTTGTHYSPDPPGTYHGGAMHHAFFRNYTLGGSPAEALFAAKRDFAANIPHGLTEPLLAALDVKIHAEYTCLGLGW